MSSGENERFELHMFLCQLEGMEERSSIALKVRQWDSFVFGGCDGAENHWYLILVK